MFKLRMMSWVFSLVFIGAAAIGLAATVVAAPDELNGLAPVHRIDTSYVRTCQTFGGCPTLAAYWNVPDPRNTLDECPSGPWRMTIEVETCSMTGQPGEQVRCVAMGTNLPSALGGNTGFALSNATGAMWEASFCMPGNATLTNLVCSTSNSSASGPNGIEAICVTFVCDDCSESSQ